MAKQGSNKNPSATKSGPGRYHKPGHQKASPIKNRGTPLDFVLHEASAEKKDRRALVKAHGRRQAIKAIKNWGAEAKAPRPSHRLGRRAPLVGRRDRRERQLRQRHERGCQRHGAHGATSTQNT